MKKILPVTIFSATVLKFHARATLEKEDYYENYEYGAEDRDEIIDDEGDSECPLPPEISSYIPSVRTALASHARAGSTWMRYLVERATGLPCGFEKPEWANVLPHYGQKDGNVVNTDGVLVKTHSSCHGCWNDAPMSERLTVEHNSSFSNEQIAGRFGKEMQERLHSLGSCLLTAGKRLDFNLGGGGSHIMQRRAMTVPCEFTYDRAILLYRYPLDNIKSNYHYRTQVLGLRGEDSWGENDHDFPRERGEAWVKFHKSWARFAKVRPTITVLYEDLKVNPVHELRRIVDFLGFQNVSDSRLQCAVNHSTMERLQKTRRYATFAKHGTNFFGTRGKTEASEKLEFPVGLIEHFTKIGMFDISNNVLGYEARSEEAFVRDDGARAEL